jgi:hypothetical protein
MIVQVFDRSRKGSYTNFYPNWLPLEIVEYQRFPLIGRRRDEQEEEKRKEGEPT